MKSVTIYEAGTKKKLYKISHDTKGYFAEALSGLVPFNCVIVTANKERITIPVRQK